MYGRKVKLRFLFVALILITLIYAYYYTDTILYFLAHSGDGKSGYHYLFSLNSIPKILRYVFNFNYQILIFLTYSLFINLIKIFVYILNLV